MAVQANGLEHAGSGIVATVSRAASQAVEMGQELERKER